MSNFLTYRSANLIGCIFLIKIISNLLVNKKIKKTFIGKKSKSKKFLFERISLANQRGNAASIRGTFPDSALLSHCKLKILFNKIYFIGKIMHVNVFFLH
jgi:hypothetical protein